MSRKPQFNMPKTRKNWVFGFFLHFGNFIKISPCVYNKNVDVFLARHTLQEFYNFMVTDLIFGGYNEAVIKK